MQRHTIEAPFLVKLLSWNLPSAAMHLSLPQEDWNNGDLIPSPVSIYKLFASYWEPNWNELSSFANDFSRSTPSLGYTPVPYQSRRALLLKHHIDSLTVLKQHIKNHFHIGNIDPFDNVWHCPLMRKCVQWSLRVAAIFASIRDTEEGGANISYSLHNLAIIMKEWTEDWGKLPALRLQRPVAGPTEGSFRVDIWHRES